MAPFDYPSQPHERRHGPRGYSSAESYRNWLRDEFAFRCVYCLDREQWNNYVGRFAVEHFQPVATRPDLRTEYDNLLYACNTCNLIKASGSVPDPTWALVSDSTVVHADGRIEGRTVDARRLIDKLLLDSDDNRAFRRRWLAVIRLAEQYAHELHRELLGYPAELLDLARLRPPKGNSRPEGIEQSHLARRKRDELPETY